MAQLKDERRRTPSPGYTHRVRIENEYNDNDFSRDRLFLKEHEKTIKMYVTRHFKKFEGFDNVSIDTKHDEDVAVIQFHTKENAEHAKDKMGIQNGEYIKTPYGTIKAKFTNVVDFFDDLNIEPQPGVEEEKHDIEPGSK